MLYIILSILKYCEIKVVQWYEAQDGLQM